MNSSSQGDLTGERVSVVIVNFNGQKYLEECLGSLEHQSTRGFETILVDNGSRDESVGYLRNRFPWVLIVENGKNLGYAGGANAGIRAARGDLILTLNNDTIPSPDFIEKFTGLVPDDPSVGMWAAKMVFPDGRINSAGICISRSGASWDRGMFEPDRGQYDRNEEVFGPCGGAALYRKKMLDDIGLFDEDFFLFMEDVDLAFRARLAGWRCMYNPSAKVVHVHGGTAGYRSALSVYYGNRNICWYPAKDFPLPFLFSSLPWIIGRSLGVIPYYLALGLGKAAIRAKMDGIRGIPKNLQKRKENHVRVSNREIARWIHTWAGMERDNSFRNR